MDLSEYIVDKTVRLKLHSAVYLWCLVVIISLTMNGCSFVSQTYQNTVAYFNTYYNARKTFDEALRELEKNKPTTLQTNLFLPANVPQPVRQKFQTVIEKCSKIIQFYPETNLMDDAVLLIGKSYYYLNEVVPAQKKFSEILENFPASDLRFEAKLMLAKTYYLAAKPNDALNLVKNLIEESLEEKERDIASEGFLLEGQIYVDRENYAQASESYNRALETRGDKKFLSHAAYLLAWCNESEGNHDAASRTYLRVVDFSPPFILEFNARLHAATEFALSGNSDRSQEVLRELQGEILNPEQRSLVEFEFGNTYQRAGEYEKALQYYETVDTLYKRTDASAKSNYQAGIIWEKHFSDLRRAKSFYDKAKSEFQQSDVTPLATKKAEVLGRYVLHRNEFDKYDSLLYLHEHPHVNVAPDSSVKAVSVPDDSVISHEISPSDTLTAAGKTTDPVQTVAVPLDTIHHRRSMHQLALGILFLVDLENPDSSVRWLTMLLNEYAQSKLVPQALYVLSEVFRSKNDGAKVDSLYDVLLTKYPDSEFSKIIQRSEEDEPMSTKTDSTEILYASAVRLLEEGRTEQAIRNLRRILSTYPTHNLNARARYALGWMYENITINKDSAIAHYRLLEQEHPNSIYTTRVRPKLAFIDGKETETLPPPSPKSGELRDSTIQKSEIDEGRHNNELRKFPQQKRESGLKKDDHPDE
jgi:tetratricopeptide (TPR) repeat protein